MNQLNELRIINDSNILYFKKINRNYKRKEIIKNILNDETCFFKMKKNDAYTVLQEIGILEKQIDSVYEKLISFDEFYRLFKCNKINLSDENILIKYPIYNSENLFKTENESSVKKREPIQENISIIAYKESYFKKILNRIKKLFNK